MKRLLAVTVLITLISCSQERRFENDFTDQIIDLTIQNSTDELVQLPDLYGTLADNIPNDNDEKLIIVEKLKEKGFNVTNWGRGNVPPNGVRIVSIELKKENCTCTRHVPTFSK